MVVYKNISDALVRAYSDSYFKIQKDGTAEVYDSVVDPIAAGRTYTETSSYIDSYDPTPSAVNTYSKYRILTKLAELGLWAKIKAWLEESGYIDFWNAAMVFSDDDEKFLAGIEYVKANLGVTQEQIAEILEYSVN